MYEYNLNTSQWNQWNKKNSPALHTSVAVLCVIPRHQTGFGGRDYTGLESRQGRLSVSSGSPCTWRPSLQLSQPYVLPDCGHTIEAPASDVAMSHHWGCWPVLTWGRESTQTVQWWSWIVWITWFIVHLTLGCNLFSQATLTVQRLSMSLCRGL